jgi:hypothetical protein
MVAIRLAFFVPVMLAASPRQVAADHGFWPAGDVDPASVAGHLPLTNGAMDPAFWGSDCDEVTHLDVYGYVLLQNHDLAVIIAEVDSPSAITIFARPRAGEFVWADANGDSEFAGEHEFDASVLISCDGAVKPDLPSTDTATAGAAPRASVDHVLIILLCAAVAAAIADRRWRQGAART